MIDNNRGNILSSTPPVTRNLIIINVLLWLVVAVGHYSGASMQHFSDFLVDKLGLHFWGSNGFHPGDFVTYMFMHDPDNPMHIIFNMFTLWMFGRAMERVWGSARFLVFYFVCGIGAALVQEIVWQLTWLNEMSSALGSLNGITTEHMRQMIEQGLSTDNMEVTSAVATFKNRMITIGASGAIFGVLLGFAFVFPNLPLYLFFIPVPIKAKYMVVGYAVLEFFLGISNGGSTVAHFAHLGGMLFGLILLLYWKKKGTLGGRIY